MAVPAGGRRWRLVEAVRLAARRVAPAAAAGAGSTIRALVVTVMAVRGVAGLALVSYGAWLAYAPAGFVVGGVLLLADRLVDESRTEPS